MKRGVEVVVVGRGGGGRGERGGDGRGDGRGERVNKGVCFGKRKVTCSAEALSDVMPAFQYQCALVQQCMSGWCRQA